MPDIRTVSIVLFDGFELLDVFGPAELFSMERDRLHVRYIGPNDEPVHSAQGVAVVPDFARIEAPAPDIVLVPGGTGTRQLVADAAFLEWLALWAGDAALVTSVCTGSAVLAAAGLLEGYRATSNKRAWAWASSHGGSVEWVAAARWVADRDRWTSSGVAAGMDMAVALIGSLFDEDAAREAALRVEYEPHTDPDRDPFAALNGLV
ncbi:MAG: DJ-1/PfpI family protein [Microbacteriaceae bacterium]|nr:DJ-1/PfpI family protein [Microbacteriaceae bacterium]MCL2794071.1 DJ-1/PfpI family protein [Microbacteriaceae bacterium]